MAATSSDKDGENFAPSKGLLLVLFEGHPWARAFLKFGIYAVTIVYPVLVALANSLQVAVLPAWLAFWVPVANALKVVFPVYQNLDAMLGARGFSERTIQLMQHVLAYEWIVSVPVLVGLLITMLLFSKSDWLRFAGSQPLNRLVLALQVGLVSFGLTLWWVTVGFSHFRENTIFKLPRPELNVPIIGIVFAFGIVTAVLAFAAFGALVVTWRGRTRGVHGPDGPKISATFETPKPLIEEAAKFKGE